VKFQNAVSFLLQTFDVSTMRFHIFSLDRQQTDR